MNVEERVAQELQREADRVTVDVTALHASTRDRVEAPGHGSAGRRGRALPLLAAAVVLLVVVLGAGSALLLHPGTSSADHSATSAAGGVETTFSCEHRTTIDFTRPQTDDAFLPTLEDGPAVFARSVEAPRWSYAVDGGAATLRLGNSDGSLASRTTFARTSGAFEPRRAELCSGVDGGIVDPGRGRVRLGHRGAVAYGPAGMVDDPDRAVLVDDRAYYDASGFRRHRSLWASPCGRALCLAAGRPRSYIAARVRLHSGRPAVQDLTDVFLPPDDLVGKKQPLGLWVVYDPGRTVTDVYARDASGHRVVDAQRMAGPSWTGPAYFVLALKTEVADVAVESSDGMTSTETGP